LCTRKIVLLHRCSETLARPHCYAAVDFREIGSISHSTPTVLGMARFAFLTVGLGTPFVLKAEARHKMLTVMSEMRHRS
jgi:hypothetical protein